MLKGNMIIVVVCNHNALSDFEAVPGKSDLILTADLSFSRPVNSRLLFVLLLKPAPGGFSVSPAPLKTDLI